MASDDNSSRHRPRFHHRARAHHSAHASANVPAVMIQHPLVPQGEPEVIASPQRLDALISSLRNAGTFAYDSEFIGELTYVPRLCLIQVASAETVALIDPLAQLDLTPFWELLCDDQVLKLVHAGQQDVEPVFRHLGRPPANLFDTQIAAGLAGLPYPISLSRLVNHYIGVQLGKGLTFTNWDQRPLSAMQIRYAADDVRYLPAVHDSMRQKLDALQHAEWAAEESQLLCQPGVYRFDPDVNYLRTRGASGLNGHAMAIIRELSIWRDAAARRHDVPPRTLLRDEVMVSLAKNPVRSVDKLSRVKGLPRPVEVDYGQDLVDATLRALAIPIDQLHAPTLHEPTPREKFFSDALWCVAQAWSFARQMDPALLTNRQDLSNLARDWLAGADPLESPLLTGWRRLALGNDLLALLRGQQSMELHSTGNDFTATSHRL